MGSGAIPWFFRSGTDVGGQRSVNPRRRGLKNGSTEETKSGACFVEGCDLFCGPGLDFEKVDDEERVCWDFSGERGTRPRVTG